MKINLTAIILTLILLFSAGCRGLSYDEQDAKDGIRQDLFGFILGLDGNSDTDYE